MSPEVAARPQLGLVEVLFWWSPVSHSPFRSEYVAFLVRMLGCSPDTTSYIVPCSLLLRSTLSFRFALPGKWHLCCIDFNITSLCGQAHFATCFTGSINIFWLSSGSVAVLVDPVIVFDILVIIVGSKLLASLFLLEGVVCVPSACSFCFFRKRHYFL